MGAISKKGRKGIMKRRSGLFTLSLFMGMVLWAASAQAEDAKITVMNPRGIKPPIARIPMAPRPATIDGKTIYIVDSRCPRTRDFVETLFQVLKEKYPQTHWVLKHLLAGGRRPLHNS